MLDIDTLSFKFVVKYYNRQFFILLEIYDITDMYGRNIALSFLTFNIHLYHVVPFDSVLWLVLLQT